MDEFLKIDENTYKLSRDGQNLSFIEVFELMVEEDSIINLMTIFLSSWKRDYFWEHPKLTQDNCNSDYEVTIIPTDAFENRVSNFNPFKDKFQVTDSVVVFPNLRKDSLLIVPNKDQGGNQNFITLRRFLHAASNVIIFKFWKTVGETMIEQITKNTKYCYLSTHGLGVLWLHIRIDQKPKYYQTKRYRIYR